jgi:hypothetical protein
MSNREFHYWPETNKCEYWEFIGGLGWYQVERSLGNDWPSDSYRYLTWRIVDNAVAKNGSPPRVMI